jgi:hypothetical protein
VDAAALILGTPLHSHSGHVSQLVRHDAGSALVVDGAVGRGVLVQQAAARNFNALLVEWQGRRGCTDRERQAASAQVRRLFDTFRVLEGKDLPG